MAVSGLAPQASSCWDDRLNTILQLISDNPVKAAIRDFHINKHGIRASVESNADRSCSRRNDQEQSAAELLDVALIIAWSSNGLRPALDPNPFRAAALPALQSICKASLQVQDFKSVKVLQKGAGSLVEVVKCRMDGQIYVLKSLVKGFAKRNAAIQTPMNEAKLLQRQNSISDSDHSHLLTPQLLAAFQTQNSVHILMEYVPSGDFSELLMAASSCGSEYPGRASTGLLTEDWIFRYSVDMVQAISWVHDQGFVHRDVKPGNFLLDRTGHLKLCDFSSAAPFSLFQVQEPPFGASTILARKVWSFFCSQPTGTCDYLSPEVLEAEEKRMLERQRRFQSMSSDDILGAVAGKDTDPISDASPDTPTPGPYGPELDWWSFGIMLYEMRFGVLPFFAEKMEQTYELIKDHQRSLKLDSSVECSQDLTQLIRQLLTSAAHRLGRRSSEQVQQHHFYRSRQVDWTKSWPVSPPFLPNSNPMFEFKPSRSFTANDAVLLSSTNQHVNHVNESLSVVSTLPSFSALYAGNPEDFPAFTDSRNLDDDNLTQQLWSQDDFHLAEASNPEGSPNGLGQRQQDGASVNGSTSKSRTLMTRSSSAPAVVLDVPSPSSLRLLETKSPGVCSPLVNRNIPRWSDCDGTFVGFSYLPPKGAFAPATIVEPMASPGLASGEMSTAPSVGDFEMYGGAVPAGWPSGTPVASTPFTRGGKGSASPSHAFPTPPSFAPSPAVVAASLAGSQKSGSAAVQTTTAAPSSGAASGHLHQHSFVTPARKPSYMAMHERFKLGQGQEPTIPEHTPAHFTPAVPQSPYPFPTASVVRTSSKFTGGKKSILMRRDLERARSATPGGGSVGSDSRQSGGSNAIREISEREAWDEMMAAVQKSVRKQHKDAPSIPLSSTRKPTSIPRSSTDPQLSASKPSAIARPMAQTDQTTADKQDQLVAHRRRPLSRSRPALREGKALDPPPEYVELDPGRSDGTRQQDIQSKPSEPALIAPRPIVMLPSPTSPDDFDLERALQDSPNHLFVPSSHHALDIDMYDSDYSDDESHHHRRGLQHKKSARQLLIKAQERGTPTKPTRTQSPSLTDAFRKDNNNRAVSVDSAASKLEAARSSPPLLVSDQSCPSSRDASYDNAANRPFPSGRARLLSGGYGNENVSPNTSTEALSSSLGKTGVTFAPMVYVPVLGAIPPLRDANGRTANGGELTGLNPSSREGARNKVLRRKDSGEMLSQYRKGMGRATSMMSLSSQAKADAASGLAASTSPPLDDDFILGHVDNPTRPVSGLHGAAASSQKALRRFSSALISKDRTKLDLDRPASQDGNARTTKSFGRFRSRMAGSALSEDPSEESKGEDAISKKQTKNTRHSKHTQINHTKVNIPTIAMTSSAAAATTLPRSFGAKATSTRRSMLSMEYGTKQETERDSSVGDVSLMTGLNHRHNALQGSLFGLEQRLAKLKARLEDSTA